MLVPWGMLAKAMLSARARGHERLFLFVACYAMSIMINATFEVTLKGPMATHIVFGAQAARLASFGDRTSPTGTDSGARAWSAERPACRILAVRRDGAGGAIREWALQL